ncbi:MAG: GNAT family N-acetyltransferase [Arcanobacterium sp.]
MKKPVWSWVELTERDIPEILKLISDIEDADHSTIRTTRAEVESYFLDSHSWRAQGACINGKLVAFGLVRTPLIADGEGTVTISGGVAKQWRAKGLGKDLMERQVEVAQSVANSVGLSPARAVLYIEGAQPELADLTHNLGFTPQSKFVTMRRNLDEDIAIDELSAYIDIVEMTAELSEDVRHIHNAILSDNGQWQSQTPQSWQERIKGFTAEWCLVAIDRFGDRPRVAGYVLSSAFSSTGEDDDEGYIEEIVVLPKWRGKSVAPALLRAAIERFDRGGMRYAGLDVNIPYPHHSERSLVDVFAAYGFSQIAETLIVQRPLN